jgi:adenosine deaminase
MPPADTASGGASKHRLSKKPVTRTAVHSIIAAMPKVELHAHISGSLRRETIKDLMSVHPHYRDITGQVQAQTHENDTQQQEIQLQSLLSIVL